MNAEEVQIHRGPIDAPYRELGTVQAKKRAKTALSKLPTPEQVDVELRKQAAKLGANAVIETTYGKSVSATSWKNATAEGKAVVIEEQG